MLGQVGLCTVGVFLRLLDKGAISFKGDPVPILVDHVKGTQHVESVVHSPLYVLEVQFLSVSEEVLPCF